MKKRYFTWVLGLCLSLGLTACQPGVTDSQDPSNGGGEPVGAVWTVTFDLNYGSDRLYQEVKVPRGQYGTYLNDYLPEPPTRNEYTFDTWYHDEACKVPWVLMRDRVYADTTLYANWTGSGGTVSTTSITWSQGEGFTYVAVSPASLPTSVNTGSDVSFRIDISNGFEGTPVVNVGGSTISDVSGVYTFTATGASMSVSVSGITRINTDPSGEFELQIDYTIPSWSPAVTNPKIYYWGTSVQSTFFDSSIDWDTASDPQCAMTLVSGNDYTITYTFPEGTTIEGLIVLMYQSGSRKQSADITVNITASAHYQISYVDTWVNDKFSTSVTIL